MLHDDFKTLPEYTKEFQPLKPGWRARAWHCVWKPTAEGIESLWETGHNPVLAYEGSFSNVVIELDFRYRDEPGKKAYLRINPTNLQLDPRAYSVSAWANANSKARPYGVILEHEEWRTQGYLSVATEPGKFESNTWHTMRLEIIGDQAMASCNGYKATGRYEKFGLITACVDGAVRVWQTETGALLTPPLTLPARDSSAASLRQSRPCS